MTIFHTPSGYDATNNPIEQFNRLIKHDYALRTKYKIGTLFQYLVDCCQHQSVVPKDFKELPVPIQQLKARGEVEKQLLFQPRWAPNYARMEMEGQPDGGLSVDVSTMTCECKYFFKFAICIHLLFALQEKSYTGLDGKKLL
ncbi:hypothetical protein F444_03835 [Phytophthora nicotianae P1976]|uniref:SWIM-type domain-containing protein n=1 Tax=Phytophthora nicotianae P1976 TaxID=1317066 RepID=A0A081ASS2_PHYNI|nr:hypothetical protein F444_03835 [Phytophthora nicotianae P1976]